MENKKNNVRDENVVKIQVVNVQGLTQTKVIDIEKLLGDNCVMCLTETQEKIRKVKISDNIEVMESMREVQDRKGGGIMVLYRKNKKILMHKQESKLKDYLFIKGNLCGLSISIIVVYFSVHDKERNKSLRREIEEAIEKNSEENLMILGDFNGHVGFKGKQAVNINGNMILDWLEIYNLVMLNDDFRCKGEITWKRNEHESVIDFVLVTQKLYKEYKEMEIDEEKQYFDLSDHNLIEVTLERKDKITKTAEKERWETHEYYKTDKDSLEKYRKEVEKNLKYKQDISIEGLNAVLRDTANKILKRKYKKKIKGEGEDRREEQPWITEDIRQSIKLRKEYNRAKRNASTPQEVKHFNEKYIDAKIDA